MRHFLIGFLSIFILTSAQSQENLNTQILSHVDFDEGGSNIWGFVDSNGVEYAVIGTELSTKILSLEDPIHPILRYEVFGSNTSWREIKSYKDHIYVATDAASDGLTIIDVSGAPDTFSHVIWKPTLTIENTTGIMTKAHSLFIDEENGIAYINGHNLANRGSIILDLKQDPNNPTYLGATNKFYCHDSYAKGNLLFSADLSNGFAIFDVSDKANPVEISRIATSSNFTHNAWISQDQKYVYTTDEVANAYIDVYDITDLSSPKLTDKFRTLDNEGQGVIPHNTYTLGKYAVTSYYTDGFIVTDMSRPDNIIMTAQYDTYDGTHGGFRGCWGVFPYFPSGIIIASDINTGLWVVKPEYKPACYLEGKAYVRDEQGALSPIQDATIKIIASQLALDNTKANGEYKTGLVTPGIYTAEFSHPIYGKQTAEVELKAGELTLQDFIIEVQTFHGTVKDKTSGLPIFNAKISLEEVASSAVLTETTDENGNFSIAVNNSSTFNVLATAWSYLPVYLENVGISSGLEFELEPGYYDDFSTDLGWTVVSTSPTGHWEIAEPFGTQVNNQFGNANSDVDDDYGKNAFVTGNNGTGAGDDDVDDGYTTLTSPSIDLAAFTSCEIHLSTWFVNAGGNGIANDTMNIYLENGVSRIAMERIVESNSQWLAKTYSVTNDQLEFTNNMRIIVKAEDYAPGHVVEGGIDKFWLTSTKTNSVTDYNSDVKIIPTICSDFFDVSTKENIKSISVADENGRKVYSIQNLSTANEALRVITSHWHSGMYFVEVETNKGKVLQKIVKL